MDYNPNIQDQNRYQRKDSPTMAMLSLVIGILSLFTCFLGFSIFTSSLGLIFSLLSRGGEREFSGYAIVGLIINLMGFLFGLLIIGICIWGIFYFGGIENFLHALTKYSALASTYSAK